MITATIAATGEQPRAKVSWHIIVCDDSAFAFQATNLSDILAHEFQSNAGSDAVTFGNKDRTKCFQRATYRLEITSRLKPSATASLHSAQRLDGDSRRARKILSTNSCQGSSGSDQTSCNPSFGIHYSYLRRVHVQNQ